LPGPVVGERRDGTDDGRPAFADEASAEAAEAGGRPGSHSQSYDPSKVPSTRRGRVKSRGSVSGENTISEMNTAPSDMLQHATTLFERRECACAGLGDRSGESGQVDGENRLTSRCGLDGSWARKLHHRPNPLDRHKPIGERGPHDELGIRQQVKVHREGLARHEGDLQVEIGAGEAETDRPRIRKGKEVGGGGGSAQHKDLFVLSMCCTTSKGLKARLVLMKVNEVTRESQ
jgi:hypothetical protein